MALHVPVRTFLAWLNQAELWFAKIQRDVIVVAGIIEIVSNITKEGVAVILNEDLSWGQVGAIETGTGTCVADAFKAKQAQKVLLAGGFRLYKFNDFNTPTRPGSKALSAWWSPYEDYQHDGGWEQRKKLAEHLGVSLREFGRVTSAVKENWNSLQYLLIVTLSKPVYAYFGGFAQMPRIDAGQASKRVVAAPAGAGSFRAEDKGSTKNLPGGGTQFYIPNLTTDEISSWQVDSLLGA